jgi:hypothetical protein
VAVAARISIGLGDEVSPSADLAFDCDAAGADPGAVADATTTGTWRWGIVTVANETTPLAGALAAASGAARNTGDHCSGLAEAWTPASLFALAP